MKVFYVITYLLLCCNGVHFQDTTKWYENRMSTEVVPPYKHAYVVIQQQILNPLILADVEKLEDDEAAVIQLAKHIHCAANDIHNNLGKAVAASSNINQKIEEIQAQTVSAMSVKEDEIRQLESNIHTTSASIHSTEVQLSQAENDVRQKENDVNIATANWRQAEQDVNKARHCIGKRFLGKIGDIVKKPFKIVEKSVCSVVNNGGINRAKDRRNEAGNALSLAQRTAGHFRQQLHDLRVRKSNFDTQLNELKARLHLLQSTRNELQQQQRHTSTVTNQLKQAIQHLESFNSTSSVLVTILKRLVEFDILIQPLNAIYNEMLNSHIMAQFPDGQISAETIQQVKESVEKLSAILPTMPLVNSVEQNTCGNWTSTAIFSFKYKSTIAPSPPTNNLKPQIQPSSVHTEQKKNDFSELARARIREALQQFRDRMTMPDSHLNRSSEVLKLLSQIGKITMEETENDVED
ncbi:unnamed protein product [Didymodactylos carnosus]|uniref:Uncharacterized protein n=1 Tax=Didymodactylos carnosus TaxID=1234261 RepID=A0A815KB43_9BILA|nr:unnamed protein product [Didymodactylos carnosus]CAF1393303.1 unnamed protein product [Didymodactylos carnosus]CAF3812856.1 unnamed protein product [Didymodactylos carnosus]CAF4287647.1 unnamed protein product [Didymodactylos carnosus]